MSLFTILFGRRATSDLESELERIKRKFADLPRSYLRAGDVFGGSGLKIIRVVCGVCDDASRALRLGLDVDNRRITRKQVANGVRRLISDARHDAGFVEAILSIEGARRYDAYLTELEHIARRIG
jgi:hypothetical protein